MLKFKLRYQSPEDRQIKLFQLEVSPQELLSSFLQKVAFGLHLETVKIIKLVPTNALKKRGEPFLLKDFKLKPERDGVIHLPVIGQQKGASDLLRKMAQEQEERNAVEEYYLKHYVDKKSSEAINRR